MRLSAGGLGRPALAALLALLALGTNSTWVTATQAPPPLTITFLANEGVQLAAGDKAVLIDALFEHYGPEFALPADSTRAALAAARPTAITSTPRRWPRTCAPTPAPRSSPRRRWSTACGSTRQPQRCPRRVSCHPPWHAVRGSDTR